MLFLFFVLYGGDAHLIFECTTKTGWAGKTAFFTDKAHAVVALFKKNTGHVDSIFQNVTHYSISGTLLESAAKMEFGSMNSLADFVNGNGAMGVFLNITDSSINRGFFCLGNDGKY